MLIGAVGLAACTSSTPIAPFTADTLRDANPSERVLLYRVESSGAPVEYQELTIRPLDDERFVLETRVLGPDRQPIDPDILRIEMGWQVFADQWTYPRDQARITNERIETPAGAFDALRIEVHPPHGADVEVFWFAPSLPGGPVQWEERREGAITERGTLIESSD